MENLTILKAAYRALQTVHSDTSIVLSAAIRDTLNSGTGDLTRLTWLADIMVKIPDNAIVTRAALLVASLAPDASVQTSWALANLQSACGRV